jgi:NADH-quinone oxidoreductase subunit N
MNLSSLSPSLLTIAPFLAVVITGMVALLVDLWLPKDKKGPVVGLSIVGLIIAAIFCGLLGGRTGITGFGGTVSGDYFAVLFQVVLLVVAALGILLSQRYVQDKGINYGEYYALLLFSTSGAMLMAAARELILIFIGLEILSIALYVLSGFARTEERSEEAAVKYFLLGAFSSGFFLYGIALIYGGTGTTYLPQIATAPLSHLTSTYTVAGIGLLLVGLCFKAAIVPFHSWTPDVYQGAPTSVTAFMSAGAKAGAFAALIRILTVVLRVDIVWHDIIWILAAATMIVGNVVALWQTDIKRMLAYSSIAHAGYILVGVLAANADGNAAVLYYILVYTFMNLGAFGIVILMSRPGREFTAMQDLDGLGTQHPFAAVLMSIFMFSLAGVPPAAGFFGKLFLFEAAAEAHLYGLMVLGFLASVVGAYYYLRVMVRMWMVPAEREFGQLSWSPGASVAIVLSAALTLLLFLFPSQVVDAFRSGAASLTETSAPTVTATATSPATPVPPHSIVVAAEAK